MEFFDITGKELDLNSLEVIRGEEASFIIKIKRSSKFYINLQKNQGLPWWGLENVYRFEASTKNNNIFSKFRLNFLGKVFDDEGEAHLDLIFEEREMEFSEECFILFTYEIKEDIDFYGNGLIDLKLFESQGFSREVLLEEEKVIINTLNYSLTKEDDYFFLDLWQHPCSWARAYGLEYFSEEHFIVLRNYLQAMKDLGQKVINLVVSDFPWAGQKCYKIEENSSRLFEYNIIDVKRKKGQLYLDFKNFDRYISLCKEIGIYDEINLFGIICNWDREEFGSPLIDYKDPIRIRVYDEDEGVFDYIRSKKELLEYLKIIFSHLDELHLLEKTYIIGDEPDSYKIFEENAEFLRNATQKEIKFKNAVLNTEFFLENKDSFENCSINTLVLGDVIEDIIGKESEKMTWYSCCFPNEFNTFLESDILEIRLTGVYTYLWKLKGMLRWSYGLFVENMYGDLTYKPEKWPAGDMFLIYPGKNMKVVHSLREKCLKYSIQDFNIFKKIEKEYPNCYDKLYLDMNITKLIERRGESIIMSKSPSYQKYLKVRNEIIKERIGKNRICSHI